MKKDSTRTGATLCSSMRPRSATTLWLKFKLLAFAFMALLSVNQVWGADTPTTPSADFTAKTYGNSVYNSSLAYGDWTIVNGANNNKGWTYFKMGGKSATISSSNPCYIYSTTGSAAAVGKVTVHLPSGSLSKSGMSVNSWGVYVYSNSTLTTQVDYVAGGTITNSEGSFNFTPSPGKTWPKGSYFKVNWNLANTTTTNGIICVDKITLYEATASTYTVNYSLTNVTSDSDNPTEVDGSEDLDLYFTAADGYNCPDAITVKVGTTTLAAGTDYTWETADEMGELQIPKAKITGDITIIIAGVEAPTGAFHAGETLFLKSQGEGAWGASSCVKVWFHGGSGNALLTPTWMYNEGNTTYKMFYVIVPAGAEGATQAQLQRFAENCSTWWNSNGDANASDRGDKNTIKTVGTGESDVSWHSDVYHTYLKGSVDSWSSDLAIFTDNSNGNFVATVSNAAPSGTIGDAASYEFRTVDGNGRWYPDANVTLSGLKAGSTYNIEASFNIGSRGTLNLTKTLVKASVRFDANGHGTAPSNMTNITPNAKISEPTAPSASGWRFDGWYTAATGGTQWNFSTSTVTESMVLYAHWTQLQSYTVTFKNNGTQTSTESVVEGGKVSSLPTLVASQAPISGYTFIGWVNHSNVWSGFEAEMTQALITGNEIINADVTYEAVWAKAYDDYGLVLQSEEVTTGNYIIDGYVNPNDYAMGNTLTSNKIPGISVIDDGGWITTTNTAIIWRIIVNGSNYAFYNAAINKYLNTVSGNANLVLQNDPAWFTLTRTDDGKGNSLCDFVANSRHLEYYNGNFDTESYKYGSIYIYKQDVSNYFVTPPAQITVTWHIGNGTQTATTYDGTAFSDVDAPEVADDAIGDCVNKFMGWATAEINIDEATAENVAWADETTISNSNKDFYAVFANAEESPDYTQITSEEDLEVGGRYLIVGNSSSTYKALPVDNADNLTTVTPSSSIISNPAAGLVWTLEGSDGAWKIKSVSNNKYLQINSGNLTFETSTSLTFSVSVSSSKFTFTSSASSGNKILSYYANGNMFNAFTTANTVYVYKSSTTYSNYATTCPTTATIKTYDGSTLLQTLTDQTLDVAVKPTAPSAKTGYDFVGWNEDQEATTGSLTFTPTIAKEYTLYAIWQAHKHTLTYANTEGATIGNGTAAGQVAYGTALTTPTNVTKPGYDFAGWSANLPATMPDNDVTITASWNLHTYTATVDQDGGTGITAMTVTYLANKLVITGTSTRDEFKLTGYLIGSTPIADKDGNLLPNVSGYTNADGEWIGTSDPTVKVEWTAIVWTDYLTDCSAPYTWTIWYEDPSDNVWKDAAITDVTSGSVVFNFTEKEQQFRFKIRKTNDGVNYTYYGASDGDNEYTYAKSLDDEHKYWTLNGNAGGHDVNVTTAAKGTYTIHISLDGDNPRIYIEYPTPYTIHFDGKGADDGSMADIVNIASGENVELPDNDFTKTNNAFVGWDTNSAGTNVVYGNQATINNVSADITLYAVWVSARYTITLDANGGTVSPDKVQQAVVGGTVALPTPTKDGYAFDGWYTEREGGSKITEAYPIPLADATYYAHWTSLETSWFVKGDFDWSTGVQFVKMPGQSSDVAFAIVEWNSDDNMNFKIYDLAEDKWYGNAGTMTRTNCTGWNVWNDNNNDTKLAPTGHGHYIFKLDLSGEYPAISVSYPNWNYDSHNSTAGTRGQGYFTYVNPLDWKYEGFILPTIDNGSDEGKQIWIGDGAWNDNYSDNWWYRWIKLNQYADETVGHGVDGAVGTLHINPFSASENYGLRFDPAGYGMKYGSGSGVDDMTGGYAFTQKTNDPAVWNTQAIENIEELQGKKFYVGLATATEGEYKYSYDYGSECNGLSAIANINDIKVWTEANPDRWGDATVGSLSNTRGHFQIWADNASKKNFYIHWIPDNKMTFDLGDAGEHIAAIAPMYRGRDLSGSEATITLPEPADWISHTFGGWVINGVQHDAGDEILLNEDMTAVAQWTTNYYKITYTGISAYSTTCDGSTYVLCGTAQTVCTPIEATGYEFSGWTSDVPLGGETEFVGGEPFTMPCEDVTFTGSYTPIVYSITYEGLEGATHSNPETYTIETPTITLQDPGARTGYEFLGWFDAETDGNQVTGIVLGSTGDTTVWAHWNAKQINVTLKANYTDGTDGSVNFTYGTKTKSAYTAVSNKIGYTLLGYYTSAENGMKILNANGDIDGVSKSGWIDADGNWIRTAADSKLYAHWSAIQGIDYYVYHYKMNVDGSYPETPTAQTSGTGHTDEVKTNLDPKTYEGFVTPEHQDLTIVYGGENILRYYYERNKYKLTWEGLEDATVTGDYTQGQVYHGATIKYPTSVSKDGYYFKGWDITPAKMPMEATKITAQWAAYENYRTYCGNAVTFVANGGMGEDYVVTTENTQITAPYVTDAGFTREGYEFIGWTKVGGDGIIIVPNGSKMITGIDGDVTYKALWMGIPTINAAVPVITSTNNVGIASAQRTLTVANPDGLEATIHIAYKKNGEAVLPTNSEFRFCNTGGNISENNITSSETAIATDFTIQYKPNAYNKIDSDYTLYITVTRKGSEAIVSSAEFNLKGRSLPEKFVIAVKNNSEQWLALPANMTGACTPAGMPITVTGEGLGMTADASVAAAYSLTGHDFAKDSAFFISVYNSKELWASESGSDIDNGGTANSKNKLNYEWGLTPTDETLISYNMANKQNGKELNYYDNSKFGMYTSGINTIYFIAVTPKEETTAVVDEWYQNKILFHLPFAMKSVSMTINGVAVADADITIVERKIKTTDYVLYELGGNIDLVAHSGQVMELTIGDGTTEYVANISIPQIIVAEVASCSALPAKADVVVRDGGHLTIDVEGAMAKSFNNVTIYPNSKISVPEGKYFNVKSLTFFGGIDEWYDTEESEYVETNIYAPELSLKGTMKADTLIYRMRVNAEHMMPVSFPYDVTISKIIREDKLDSPSWGKVGTDIRLETYNGELRAAGNRRYSDESTWTEIKEGTLTAGIGYTVAAQKRFKNYPYTVLDFPMANPYKSVAAEEVAKNAAVQAHDAVNWYDKGWNLMGNPYMAGITGAGAIKVNETDYDFVYIPTADGEDYYQGPLNMARILPFMDFFVQVNEGGTMYFDLTKRVDAPARMLADIERTAQFSIGLAGANKTDITYFKVADNFTESYDIPGDNAKMFGSAVNTKVYSLLNGEDQLAQMALNADMTAQPIQLGYIAPENGEYIFALDNTYTDYQNVEHIYLLENGEIKVDLLNAQYTFTTEAKTEDERFAILIVMKGAKMPTDLMDGLFNNDVASPKKVIYNDHFYILNTNRRVYDGTGKYINKMQKNK